MCLCLPSSVFQIKICLRITELFLNTVVDAFRLLQTWTGLLIEFFNNNRARKL
ncbi:Uncharacterized protein APZ42_030980 [Daphnia magna]|uniref:Uncharacterized protein n=1 Tax=Daphnia magna TaxID=35525 RepID=A0A164N7L7_9CRUS|nr:Uncharacterized protein APZ42_030980 [Daphnia magna]